MSSIVKRLTNMDKVVAVDDSKLAACVELDHGDRDVFLE